MMLMAAGAAAIAVAAIIIAGAMGRSSGGSVATSATTMAGKTLGKEDAPVTITAWEDFQCPFCKQVNSGAVAQVVAEYVNTGKVKIIYQQFPFLGTGGSNDESMLAAEASECAAEQHLFWAYHDSLFAAQSGSGENRGVFTMANLKKLAQTNGLDQEAFNSCLDSHKYRSAVEDQKAEGKKLGVESTPTFFVNGQRIVGAQPYSVFKRAIERALAASPGS
jgi:protein-disulfide isomerase